MIECAGPFRAKSQFPIIRWLSWSQALLIIKSSVLSSAVFKDRYNGGSSFWCSSPGLGEPMWVLIPSLLKGEDLHACDIPSSCESPCRAFGSWLSLPFYSFQYGLFFFKCHCLWEDPFCQCSGSFQCALHYMKSLPQCVCGRR